MLGVGQRRVRRAATPRVQRRGRLLGAARDQPRVGQQQHRDGRPARRVDDRRAAAPGRRCSRPVDRGDHVRRRPGRPRPAAAAGRARRRRRRTRRQTSVITSPTSTRARGQALVGQVAHRDLGRGQQQVGGVVGEHPVVLLGHPPVERAQARLEVRDRQVQLHRGQRAGERRVGVAVDQHPVRALLGQDRVEGGQHRAGLHAVAARPDAEVHVRRGDRQVGEEHVGHVARRSAGRCAR